MTTTALYQPRAQARALGEKEHSLRQQVGIGSWDGQVVEWARVLELSLVFVTLNDTAVRLGLRTVRQLKKSAGEVASAVRTLTGLSLDDVVAENARLLETSAKLDVNDDEVIVQETDAVARAVQSLLLHCPIDALTRSAGADHPEQVHRCKMAYDGLRAFVARHSHPDSVALAVIGRAYAEGRLSIDEAAKALSFEIEDTVALLEEQGFRRSVDTIRLDEATRNARLTAIRQDRLARRGQPSFDERLVARDVVASQRIEDIDARPWLVR